MNVFCSSPRSQLISTLALLLLAGCAHQAKVAVPPQAASIALPQADLSNCPTGIDSMATQSLGTVSIPPVAGSCTATSKNGRALPDTRCNPGAINPTLTLAVLQDPNYRTGCVRNNLTSEDQKNATYTWYSITKPDTNTGQTQVCELDHIVPLYIGGADSLDNIWPQCGPDAVTLNNRFFKQKDRVEVYLGAQVRAGKMSLIDAQRGIATDWTQYLSASKKACARLGCSSLAPTSPIE